MKIAVLIDELISGGFQKVALMEVKYLRNMGYDADLVVLHRTRNLGYQDIIKDNNIKVVFLSDRLPRLLRLNFRIPFFSFFSFFHIFYPLFIYRFIKGKEYDYFVSHGTYTMFSSIAISKHRGIPYVGYVHDSVTYILRQKYKKRVLHYLLSVLMPLANYLDKLVINNSLRIVAYPFMINQMTKLVQDPRKYTSIYNGCELDSQGELRYDRENFCIAVTKWDEGKNFELLIDVWLRITKKVILKVVGTFHPKELEEKYNSLIKQRGLESSIEIVGGVDELTLASYYKKAKLLIHPCREAFGMTILEAAALGCPSIFTSNSGVAELFPAELIKTLPKEGVITDYIEAINTIENLSSEEYKDLVKAYYRVAEANSWEMHCKKLIEVLNKK